MPSLRDKLRATQGAPRRSAPSRPAASDCFVRETRFPLPEGARLADGILQLMQGDPNIPQHIAPDGFLFLDTETTGLSHGAGTVAFLVGIGFFDEGGFVVRQYLMRDYDEEAALLNVGGFDPKGGALSVIGDASRAVAGAAGETTRALTDRGIPSLVMADGPAGLRLSRQYTVDENGAHGVGESLPQSIVEWLPDAALLFMSLTGGKRRPRAKSASSMPPPSPSARPSRRAGTKSLPRRWAIWSAARWSASACICGWPRR